MAAKQGLTAQLSQAGEDAKRAVLSRTGVTSTWFSNLNTVCTIKSAPPRSPEVLQMLATKSGWLFKRNEQHVWQARWCCVVPHTFLYYFDSNIVPGQASPIPNPTQQQQEEWNKAVQQGYGDRKQHEKRTGLYWVNQGANEDNTEVLGGSEQDPAKYSSSQPAGIIDLECYSSVHRSSENKHVLELAGDDQVNPDLRAFYFFAGGDADSDDWTNALLNGRHSALTDECEAYKQVCDGFAQQLQVLHSDLDQASRAQEESQDELYRVRSLQEDARRSCWRLIEESMERTDTTFEPRVREQRRQFRQEMETVRNQDMGVPALVRLLLDYTVSVEDIATDVHKSNQNLEKNLAQSGHSDQVKVESLSEELEALKAQFAAEKKQMQTQIETLSTKYQQSQQELKDVQKSQETTKVETTMYFKDMKTKFDSLKTQKSVLKKEVHSLRGKLEKSQHQLSELQNLQERHKMKAECERDKNEFLVGQMKMQQNMMEMMSQSGVGSVMGGSVAFDHRSMSSIGRKNLVVLSRDIEGDVKEDEKDDIAQGLPRGYSSKRDRRRQHLDDMDNKSHMSELTEDRTQRHFEAISHHDYGQFSGGNASPGMPKPKSSSTSPRTPGPPSFIGVANKDDAASSSRLATISSGAHARRDIPRGAKDSASVSSGKMSLAQRMRQEADRKTTPVKARMDENSLRQVRKQQKGRTPSSPRGRSNHDSSNSSQQGSGIWKRLGDAVLGPDDMSSSSGGSHSLHSTRVTNYTEGEGSEIAASEVSEAVSSLSLQERSRIQRERQLRFLKDRGLAKDDVELLGGAGVVSPTSRSEKDASLASG